MNQTRINSGTAMPPASGDFFELVTRCFFSCLKSRVHFSLSRFSKTASAWSKIAFSDGLKSRHDIETNEFFKMQLRKAQKWGFEGFFLKLEKSVGFPVGEDTNRGRGKKA